jgi:hypothetical protein
MQTMTTTAKPSPRYTLSHRLTSAALCVGIGVGRMCRLLPKDTDFFVEPALSPRLVRIMLKPATRNARNSAIQND